MKRLAIFLILLSGCSVEPDPTGFETPEQLKNSYAAAYKSGDIKKIMSMVFWGDSPAEQKELMEFALTYGIGEMSITNLELFEIDEFEIPQPSSGPQAVPTTELTNWLKGEVKNEKGDQGNRFRIPIGKVGKKYFISGFTLDE